MQTKMEFPLRKREVIAISLSVLCILEDIVEATIIVRGGLYYRDDYNQSGSDVGDDDAIPIYNMSSIEFESDVLDYPYDQLLKIVKDTKELLTSKNINETRKILNFDQSDYELYLKSFRPMAIGLGSAGFLGPTLYGGSSVDSADFGGAFSSEGVLLSGGSFNTVNRYQCDVEVRVMYPKKWKDIDGQGYYILNVGDMFVQKVEVHECRNRGSACGDPSSSPENRNTICSQSYAKIRGLFSIPVREQIHLRDQKVHKFKIPDACKCRRMGL